MDNMYDNMHMGPQNISDYGIPFDGSESCGEYREIASFSSEDLQDIINQNRSFMEQDIREVNTTDFIAETQNGYSSNIYCDCVEEGVPHRHFLEINLKHSEENEYDIANNLILDGCTSKYICDMNGFIIDGIPFYPNFSLRGIFEDVYAKNSDRTLKFSLCESVMDSYKKEEDSKADTTYGFKLSQILENIGDLDKVNGTREIISINEYANVTLTQKAIIYRKGSTRFIVFKFKLKNEGTYVAKKLLFKDIFPQNIKLIKDGIFRDGLKIGEESVNFEGRRVIVKIDELEAGRETDLIIVGALCEDCKTINVGVLSYISGYTQQDGVRRLNINQVMSNMKTLREKGCN